MDCTNNFWKTIKTRRSIRRYSPEMVQKQDIVEIIEAATWAPSAHNRQTWDFIVTFDRSKIDLLSQRRYSRFLTSTPCAIIVTIHWDESTRKHLSIQNGSAATQNLLLAARAKGLGTCWIGDFDEDMIRNEFGLPNDRKVLAVIALGYPSHEDDFRDPPSRKPLDQVLHWERF